MDRAYAAAVRRKVCPDAFDSGGNPIRERMGIAVMAMIDAGLNPFTGRPEKPCMTITDFLREFGDG